MVPKRESPDLGERTAFFVTGTDTDIGKTLISAILMRGLAGTYWKPIQSGVMAGDVPATDTESVRNLTGLKESHFIAETYRLREPASPHHSSRLENLEIEIESITMPEFQHSPLIVEGAGGVMVPLNSKGKMIADLISHLSLPAIVIARSTLGTINHTVLTVEALRRRDIPVLGVVLNGPPSSINEEAIATFAGVPILASVPILESPSPESIERIYNERFAGLFRAPARR
ncbi:MAG: dethiobiotin synthase [Candidatus Melainabacteria bacterium]|nr:dethiobiotin synthase [Candidatus Melainabacteria bacterium]